MKTARFILAIAELVASPAILAIYGVASLFATLRPRAKPVLDFSLLLR